MTDDSTLRAAEAALWHSLGAHPTEQRIHLAGVGADVRVQELGAGPPVLFVHGGSTWGTSWADLVVQMTQFRCLLLDRPGAGLSDPLPREPHSLGELRAHAQTLIPDVLDALGLSVVDVVATSFGGWFALQAALIAPDRVRRMAIVGWTAGAPVARLPLSLRIGTLPVIGDIVGRLPAGGSAVRAIFRSIGQGPALDAGRIAPEAIEAYAVLLRHTQTYRHDRALGRLFLSPHRGLNASMVLTDDERRRIATPILFAWGEADPFGGSAIATDFAAGFPNARLKLLPSAGHAPWMGDPAPVANLISAYLTD